ncbi:MAG: mechanosensitive ion channel family protein [Saprospiraceae bacterium]
MTSLTEILEYNFLSLGGYNLNLLKIIVVTLIYAIIRFLLWLSLKVITRFFKRKNLDSGREYAVTQFVKYIIYTAGLLIILESLGVQLSLLWAGSAALLVGVGLGLQQTFNDLISGIILLIEGSVEVGDILEIETLVGKVTKIGLRTSIVVTRDDIVVVLPNSKLVTDSVINWNHNHTPTRFKINVGVSYNSDVDEVSKLILEAINNHPKILNNPKPQVQFADFGSSSLDFTLYFFSHEFFRIELVKSDLRYSIFRIFRKNNIEIPFPQHDLWLRNPEVLPHSSKG